MTVEIDQMFSLPGRIIVGAWFSTPAGGGARLKFQSVWQFRETWNEPAISINAYVPDEQASALYEDLIQEGSLLIANCSPTSWGLATVAEMTGEFPHVTQMVHGRTYFKESVAQRDLVDGFQRRAGPDRVHQVPSGVVLVGNRWRAGTVEEREVHGFLQEELRRLAMTIMSNQGRPV